MNLLTIITIGFLILEATLVIALYFCWFIPSLV